MLTSHRIAFDVQDYLFKNKSMSVSLEDLRALVFRFIKEEVNLEYAEKYLLWQSVGKLGRPIIMLIGGSTENLEDP